MKEILSLPIVRKVKEVYSFENTDYNDHAGFFMIIVPDPKAGLLNMYSVIIFYYDGIESPKCIGRELPLKQARAIAKKYIKDDISNFYTKYRDGKKLKYKNY